MWRKEQVAVHTKITRLEISKIYRSVIRIYSRRLFLLLNDNVFAIIKVGISKTFQKLLSIDVNMFYLTRHIWQLRLELENLKQFKSFHLQPQKLEPRNKLIIWPILRCNNTFI